jgi:hypothetical protein
MACHYTQVALVADVADLFGRLARTWGDAAAPIASTAAGREDVADLLFALDESASGDEADRRLATFYGALSGLQLAALCEALSQRDAKEQLDLTLTWCARNADVTSLRSVLHDAGAHAVAYRRAERAGELA